MKNISPIRYPDDWQLDLIAFGKWVRDVRKHLELTQDDLGELAGVTQKELSRIEVGSNEKLSFNSVCRLCYVLGSSPSEVAERFGAWKQRVPVKKVRNK